MIRYWICIDDEKQTFIGRLCPFTKNLHHANISHDVIYYRGESDLFLTNGITDWISAVIHMVVTI